MIDARQMETRQKVLADFGEFALRSDDLDAVLTEACRLVAEALGTGRAKVLQIEKESRSLFVRAGVGWSPGVVGQLRLPMAEHSSETFSIRAGQPVITNDLASEDRFDVPAFMKQAGVRALANVPIFLLGGSPFGLLQVDAPEPRAFGDEDSQFLRTYATILGPVIDRLLKLDALGATEERFQAIVEAARDYAIFLTDAEDRITDWLPGAEAVFGWSAEEAIGQPGAILFTPADRAAGQPEAEVEEARQNGSAPNVRWHQHKDGSQVFIEGSVVALRNAAGGLRGFQKIGQDVTKRRRAEEALRESEELRRIALESGGMGAWRWDTRARTVRADDVVQDLWGIRALEQPHPVSLYAEQMSPEGVAWLEAGMTRDVAPGEEIHCQMQVAAGPAAGHWVELRGRAERDRPWIVNGVTFDVTEQRLVEQKLRSSEERFRLLVESVRTYAIFTVGSDGLITSWPAGAAAVFGWSEAEILGRPVDLTFVPEDVATQEPLKERETALQEGVAPNVREHLRKDGSRIFINGSIQPLARIDGRIGEFIKIGQDVTDARRVQQALAESEQRLRTLTEGIPQLVWRSGDDGRWTWSSPQWQAFTGQTMEGSLGRGWLDVIHPDDRDGMVQAWDKAPGTGTIDVESRVRRALDGAFVWHHTRSLPVRTSTGRIVEWLGTTTDVQQGKERQERQAVMVAELQHRTRNLIAVVRSIAHQTIARTGPTEAFTSEFGHRLEALARVQGLLSRADEEPVTIEGLIRMELDALGALGTAREQVVLSGPSVRLRNSMVQTLALGLHELATNARKHGALSRTDGRLAVTWRIADADGEGRRLVLEWTETGARDGAGPAPERRGYGRELIEQALPYTLGARTAYEMRPDGVRCTIDLPLDRNERRRRQP